MLSPEAVAALVKKWSRIIGIKHWILRVRVVPHSKLRVAGSDAMLGLTVFDDDTRVAHIWVVNEDAPHIASFEFTLVHELVHVFIADMLGRELPQEELVINGITRALFYAHGQIDDLGVRVDDDSVDDHMNALLTETLQQIALQGGVQAMVTLDTSDESSDN